MHPAGRERLALIPVLTARQRPLVAESRVRPSADPRIVGVGVSVPVRAGIASCTNEMDLLGCATARSLGRERNLEQ